MIYLQTKLWFLQKAYTVAGIVSALVFGNITAVYIYNVLVENAVFMTTIHGILLNPFFLLSGAYLGIYGIYLLILSLIRT